MEKISCTNVSMRICNNCKALKALHCKKLIESLSVDVGIPKDCLELCAQIFAYKPRTKVVWLHMAECSGCSESFLRLDKPGVESYSLNISP